MTLTVACQMDPLDKINIAGDSTFALMLKAQARGHRLFYYPPEALNYSNGRVWAKAWPVEVRADPKDHFTLGGPVTEFEQRFAELCGLPYAVGVATGLTIGRAAQVSALADMLAEDFGVASDVWSAPSFTELRREGLEAERWNRLHPEAEPRQSYVETLLDGQYKINGPQQRTK